MKVRLPAGMVERTIWALWWLLFAGASLWLMVGSAAYFVRSGYLPPDTAGWAQALGGFLAVAVAIGVPYFQARQALALREVEGREGRAEDCAAVYSIVSHFQELMRRLQLETRFQFAGYVCRDGTLVREMRDAAEMVRSVSVNGFSSHMVFFVLGLRKVAAFFEYAADKLEEAMSPMLLGKPPVDHLRIRAGDELAKLETWLTQVGDYEAALRLPR